MCYAKFNKCITLFDVFHSLLKTCIFFTQQKVQHQPQHPHLPGQSLQQVCPGILQIIIHCGSQEIGDLNVLS